MGDAADRPIAERRTSQGFWYHAEYACSDQSTCREFRCKRKIGNGELRIGIQQDSDDAMHKNLGWFCFEDAYGPCLWKTFRYRNNGNEPIADEAMVTGLE